MKNNTTHDARSALYDLLAGAEGCGAAARRAQDDELADFLCGV